MSNKAVRNVTAIMRTQATAELQAEVEKELDTNTPEVSVASLVGDADATESDETEELCDQSSADSGSEDSDSAYDESA